VAGSGVHLSGAWSELARLSETADIPVATTIHGKGSVPESIPTSLGVVGANGARDYANEYLAGADVVLFVGTRANATDTNSYTSPSREGTVVIQNDIDAERAGRNFPGSIGLVGDAKVVLGQLLSAIGGGDGAERGRGLLGWISDRRRAWLDANSEPRIPDGEGLLDPRDVVRAVREEAGAGVILTADPGTPTPNVASYWEVDEAAREVIVPRGHGPMGYAIPSAIGAALSSPGSTVVGLTADGSFAMACGELETAVRLRLPVVYVQFTNGSMGWIKMLQHLYMGGRYFDVDLGPIDAVAVARGMGLDATRVTDIDAFREALRRGLASQTPTFIDVPVPDQTDLVPPVAPWHEALSGKAGRPVY